MKSIKITLDSKHRKERKDRKTNKIVFQKNRQKMQG